MANADVLRVNSGSNFPGDLVVQYNGTTINNPLEVYTKLEPGKLPVVTMTFLVAELEYVETVHESVGELVEKKVEKSADLKKLVKPEKEEAAK